MNGSKEELRVAARLRRAAKRQQYQLRKNTTRDPLAPGYGLYELIDVTGNRPDPCRGNMNLGQVADYLHQGPK